MQAAVTERPDLVQGSPDLNIRKGVGYGEDRTHISYPQYEALMQTPEGRARVRKLAVIMRAPLVGKNGAITPGAGEPVAMPAEKFQKWYGQGYRPTNGVDDHSLYEFPTPQPPNRWYPSMVEEAIARGEPIPRDLKPAGYSGPVFDLDAPAGGTDGLTVYRCEVDGCQRFFDSPQGLARHTTTEHKE